MLDFAVSVLVVFYGLALSFVLFHSLTDAHLVYYYLLSFRKKKKAFATGRNQPSVTVQLPIYNEVYVVERLIDVVAAIDYPAEKLEVQVLDDSTDETTEVIAKKVACLQQRNISIQHIRRTDREGFKAGALKHGLAIAKGELVAIFDADFLPPEDFLQKTTTYFEDERVGMVQTKWGHINKSSSLLTSLQAIALDGHFSIEQKGRNSAGYFINFNGTGGVWRKTCIINAGNWEADTLTEDLDLSYRAQLKGWKFIYLENVETPAELPPVISAFKSQQFRWAKGGAETAKKNLKKVLSSRLPFSVKWHGLFHLIYSFGFVSIIISMILSVPLMVIRIYHKQYETFFQATNIITISFLIYIIHYFISYAKNTAGSVGGKIAGFIIRFPLFVSLFIGVSLNNAIGIVQGYSGIKSPFIRTPKFNTTSPKDAFYSNKYTQIKISFINVLEGVLFIYFLFAIILSIQFNKYTMIPVFAFGSAGFTFVFISTFKERRGKLKKA